jgi:uncharacterized membrane protein YphA (DoxX/SURF4 family)
MSTFATILSALLGLAFLGAGGTKLANVGPHEQEFARYDLPGVPAQTARVLVGATEVLAAVLLLIAVVTDSAGLARVGAVILVVAMIGAVGTHLRLRDPVPTSAPAAVLGVLAAVLVATA